MTAQRIEAARKAVTLANGEHHKQRKRNMSTTQLDLDEVPTLEVSLLLDVPGAADLQRLTVVKCFDTNTQAELAALQTLKAVQRVLDKAAQKGGKP